jgi:N-acetylmuramoyl-L-alanine amidase
MAMGVRSGAGWPWPGLRQALGCLVFIAFAAPVWAQTRPQTPVEQGAALPVADGFALESGGDVSRLIFDLTSPVAAKAHVLADPDRVIVDLPEVNFQIDPALGLPAAGKNAVRKPPRGAKAPGLDGLVSSFRFGLVAPAKSRIVIDLAGPAKILRVASEPGAGGRGARFVIELAKTDRVSFLAAASAAQAPVAVVQSLAAPATPVESALPMVVLDAGHGGIDTGALGAAGALEKDIVFEFAKALAARLEAGRKVRVSMTRDSDIFISLGERVRRARAAGASLFISIHADTLTDDRSVSGATVYTASEKASDAEAARVAEKENQADLAAGLDGREDQSEVSDILVDLTRRETRAYSNVFARTLVGYWKEVGLLNKNPHRFAGFRVLRAHDVPSVLLEVGYLSSDKDLASLTAPVWRDKATATVARAVEGFFQARGAGEGRAAAGPDPFGTLAPPRSPAGRP